MVNLSKLTKKRLGEILVEEGLLKDDQLQDALKRQKETGELIGEALVKLGYITEFNIALVLAKQFGLPYLNAALYSVPAEAIEVVPRGMLYEHHFIVLDKIGGTLIIAISRMLPIEIFEEIERKTGARLFVYVSTAAEVTEALQKYVPEAAVGEQ